MTDDELDRHLLDLLSACEAAAADEQLAAGRARLRRAVDAAVRAERERRERAESLLVCGVRHEGRTCIEHGWTYPNKGFATPFPCKVCQYLAGV